MSARCDYATAADFFRFALWASSRQDAGKSLTAEQVRDHIGKDRATAYRWLAAYFDAQGWCWPRPKESAMPKPRSEGAHPWREANSVLFQRRVA